MLNINPSAFFYKLLFPPMTLRENKKLMNSHWESLCQALTIVPEIDEFTLGESLPGPNHHPYAFSPAPPFQTSPCLADVSKD